jgi:CheY-like chemotaxis protein
LEQTRQLAKTPIIAVTANALIGDRERYFEAGMDGYVSKPLSSDSLKTEIERVLAR